MRDIKKVKTGSERAFEKNAARRRKRRGSKKLYWFLLFSLVLFLLFILSVTVFFNAGFIEVEGETQYSDEEIIAVSGLKAGQNLLKLNPSKHAQTVLAGFAMLDAVDVQKKFPDRIIIKVTKAVPRYAVRDENEFNVLSENLRIIENAPELPSGVVLLHGVDLPQRQLGHFVKSDIPESVRLLETLLSSFNNHSSDQNKFSAEKITSLDIGNRTDIRVTYDERIEIRLGSESQIDYKIKLCAKVLQEQISESEHGIIDATVPGRASFKPEN